MFAKLKRIALLLHLALATATVAEDGPWFPVLDNQAAWDYLPKTKDGSRGGPLPAWARILARSLPSTTAAMLEMDYVQRVKNPLEPTLRAKIRWVAAQANGSEYAAGCAQADFLRAGGNAEELRSLAKLPSTIAAKDQRVLTFARQLCEAAYEITDDEVRLLVEERGPETVTAIVLTVAYANFQDRLFHSLGIKSELGEFSAPLNVHFDWEDLKLHPVSVPARTKPAAESKGFEVPIHVQDPDWHAAPLTALESRLATQQLRAPRIPIPPDEVVERQTPVGMSTPGRAAVIRWNAVAYGYQPELTQAWFFSMRRFREESKLPDDFRQSVFWVVTRSNMCFY